MVIQYYINLLKPILEFSPITAYNIALIHRLKGLWKLNPTGLLGLLQYHSTGSSYSRRRTSDQKFYISQFKGNVETEFPRLFQYIWGSPIQCKMQLLRMLHDLIINQKGEILDQSYSSSLETCRLWFSAFNYHSTGSSHSRRRTADQKFYISQLKGNIEEEFPRLFQYIRGSPIVLTKQNQEDTETILNGCLVPINKLTR